MIVKEEVVRDIVDRALLSCAGKCLDGQSERTNVENLIVYMIKRQGPIIPVSQEFASVVYDMLVENMNAHPCDRLTFVNAFRVCVHPHAYNRAPWSFRATDNSWTAGHTAPAMHDAVSSANAQLLHLRAKWLAGGAKHRR